MEVVKVTKFGGGEERQRYSGSSVLRKKMTSFRLIHDLVLANPAGKGSEGDEHLTVEDEVMLEDKAPRPELT